MRYKPMEAIRRIQRIEKGEVHFQLPQQFWGQEVEIIVLTVKQQPVFQTEKTKKSLRGSLKHYANPALIEKESTAWLDSVEENNEHG